MDISALKKKYALFLKDNLPFWVVDSTLQKIVLVDHLKNNIEFPVSTAKNGLGNKEGSFKTPTGLLRIHDLIGSKALRGMIFIDRKATGRIWDGLKSKDGLILTRVITLDGCEDNINKGSDVDTLSRYIYIHGTDSEDLIGTPASRGCIGMKNKDIIELFNLSSKGMFVLVI
ncbi:MAG: L,D-transpeptidase [Thermodesulfobacteriota bacterium]